MDFGDFCVEYGWISTPQEPEVEGYVYRYFYDLWLLHRIVGCLLPRRIVEFGVRAGYSAWAMLSARPNARYVGFDTYDYPGVAMDFRENFNRLVGQCSVHIFKEDTVVPGFTPPPADFYHIDSAKVAGAVRHQLLMCRQTIPNAIFVLHDFKLKEVEGVVMEVMADSGQFTACYHSGAVNAGNGYAVVADRELPVIEAEFPWMRKIVSRLSA